MASWSFYNKWKSRQLNGNATNFSSATAVKLILIITSPSVVPTSGGSLGDTGLAFVSDLVPGSNEVTGTNYARTAFGTMTVSAPSSGVVTVSGTAITYTSSGSGFSNAQYLVLADVSSGSDATSPVIMAANIGTTFGNTAGNLTINTDSGNAIFTLT